MQRHALINAENPAGLLIIDSRKRPVYVNAEAIRILAYPEDPEKIKSSGSYLTKRIRSVVLNGEGTAPLPAIQGFISGRRHYLCRFFVFESNSNNPLALTVAVLMERAHQLPFLLSSMTEQFHFTRREKEAVRLLFEGLTSKEIAGQMQISPNTVKAFLRFVMVKMGVSTRLAILTKILRRYSRKKPALGYSHGPSQMGVFHHSRRCHTLPEGQSLRLY